MFVEIRIHLLLDFCYFVKVLDGDIGLIVVSGLEHSLWNRACFFQKVCGWRRLNFEVETTVLVRLQNYPHWHIASEFLCAFIELLAEVHHIHSQGSKGLTDFW